MNENGDIFDQDAEIVLCGIVPFKEAVDFALIPPVDAKKYD